MSDELLETQLFDLDVAKVDLVGRPAVRRGWAVMKEDTGGNGMEELEKKVDEVQPDDAPITETAEEDAVQKAELAETIAKELAEVRKENAALRKDLELSDISKEAICKDVGMKADAVWALRKAAPEQAEAFIAKCVELYKQADALMVELGKANAGAEVEPHDLIAKARKLAKEKGISEGDAIEQVAKEDKSLALEYIRERQNVTATHGR